MLAQSMIDTMYFSIGQFFGGIVLYPHRGDIKLSIIFMDHAPDKKKLVNRMSRLIGHAQSNKRKIEEDAYCFDIIDQNLAVIAALHKVNEDLLNNHLHTCVLSAMRSGGKKEQEKVIQEILQIYNKAKS